jgi:DNA-binding GntR family transcriptional regulator
MRPNRGKSGPVPPAAGRKPSMISRSREAPLSATEIAYTAIRGDILSTKLRPGDAVPLETYVSDLKLSRTPVREATLRLEREGFIEIRARLGTFVSHLDLRQIQEMYEVRMVVEGHAARLAAERADPAEVKRVEAHLTALKANGHFDVQALSEAGQLVHKLIVESCGNQLLADTIRSLQDHFTRFRSLSLAIPQKVVSSHREHLAILRAMRARDGSEAERLVREHFSNAAQSLVQGLIQGGNPGAPKVTVQSAAR